MKNLLQMTWVRRTLEIGLIVSGASILATLFSFSFLGLIFNASSSMKTKLWIQQGRLKELRGSRNEVIVFCVENNQIFDAMTYGRRTELGTCKNQRRSLVKEIIAVPGDLVEVTDVVRVNGSVVAHSKLNKILAQGSQVQNRSVIVEDGTVWVLGTNSDRSFDSRYYGAVRVNNSFFKIRPLLPVN